MVWGKQHDPSACEDVAASGLDSVRAKPLKRRCGSRGGLSRFYSSKSQSFSCISSMLDVAPCNGSARALAKRPSSFDLCRDADSGCTGRFAPSRLERPCLATTNESSTASDDIDDDVFAVRCPCNDTIFDEQEDDREQTSLSEGPLEASHSSSTALPIGMPQYSLPPYLSRSLNLSSLALPGTLCALVPPTAASSLPTCAAAGSIALATLATQQPHQQQQVINPAGCGALSGPILVPSHPHLPHPHQQQLQHQAQHAPGGTCQPLMGTWHLASGPGLCCQGGCSSSGGACEVQSGTHSLCYAGPCLSPCASGDCGGSMLSQASSEATHWSRGSTTTSCGGSLVSDAWSRQYSVLQHEQEQHQQQQQGHAQGAAGAGTSGSPCCGLWGSTEDLIAALSISEQQERKGPTRGSRLHAATHMQHQQHQHQHHLRRSASHAYAAHTRSAKLLLHAHNQQQQQGSSGLPAQEQQPMANSLSPAVAATHAAMPASCCQQQQQQQQLKGAQQPHPYLYTHPWGYSAAASAAAATAAMVFGGSGCQVSLFGSAPATAGLASHT